MARRDLSATVERLRAEGRVTIGGQVLRAREKPKPRSKHRAVKTRCTCGRIHASKMEARVCQRLQSELAKDQVLYHQVRLPLFNLAPDDSGVPMYVTIDFAIACRGQLVRLIDAKPKRRQARSRDWRRGAKAVAACYGIRVEEVEE